MGCVYPACVRENAGVRASDWVCHKLHWRTLTGASTRRKRLAMCQTNTHTADVGQAGEAAEEQARQVGQQSAEKSREAANVARGRAREQVDQRTTQAGEQLGTVAGDTRTVSEELRKQGKEQPAKIAEQAADRVEQV